MRVILAMAGYAICRQRNLDHVLGHVTGFASEAAVGPG